MADLPKMMPGSDPYTPEEWERVQSLIRGAAHAVGPYSEDELEEHAACLARLRDATARGADLATLDSLERAAWALGATPADTDRATQEGAEVFAKRVTVIPEGKKP